MKSGKSAPESADGWQCTMFPTEVPVLDNCKRSTLLASLLQPHSTFMQSFNSPATRHHLQLTTPNQPPTSLNNPQGRNSSSPVIRVMVSLPDRSVTCCTDYNELDEVALQANNSKSLSGEVPSALITSPPLSSWADSSSRSVVNRRSSMT